MLEDAAAAVWAELRRLALLIAEQAANQEDLTGRVDRLEHTEDKHGEEG